MKIYVSGPMTGYPDSNFPAFNELATLLRKEGHEVVNPAELDGAEPSKPWGHYMRRDLPLVIACEAVALLPYWHHSRGAVMEVLVAKAFGKYLLGALNYSWIGLPYSVGRLLSGDTALLPTHALQQIPNWFRDADPEKLLEPETGIPEKTETENDPAPGQSGDPIPEDEYDRCMVRCAAMVDEPFDACVFLRDSLVEVEEVIQDDVLWLHWIDNAETVLLQDDARFYDTSLDFEVIDDTAWLRHISIQENLNKVLKYIWSKAFSRFSHSWGAAFRAQAPALEWEHHTDGSPCWCNPVVKDYGGTENSGTILDEAKNLVLGDRGNAYGHPFDDFSRTAKIWSAIFGHEVTPHQVGLGMIAVKMSRLCHSYKKDSVTDIAGYAQTLQMVEEEIPKRAHQAGDVWDNCDISGPETRN